MLKLTGISKSFRQRGKVLDNLELEVKEGETVAISGPSGSGKTTLLNMIGLLDRPDSGDIVFKGESILKFTMDEAATYRSRNIGFVFQEHLLLPHLTILGNILLPLMTKKLSSKSHAGEEKYAGILMEDLGITGIAEKYPFQISGGEAQRTALVRALVNKPSLLLADEPTGSLDSKNAGILSELLQKINIQYGISIILATHSSDLAGKMLLRYRLDDGHISSY
jgi:lipoprotein-releasing system ATP-binding protein